MKNKEFDISQRARKSGEPISKDIYANGILDIIDFLFLDLKKMMAEEGRAFGIVKSYTTTIQNALSQVQSKDSYGEEIETYGRILYLFKPLLRREFNRLKDRKLSPADANICLIRKILGIISELPNYENEKEVNSIKKVIDHLWDNIRNRSKKDSLFLLADVIRKYMSSGIIGKHALDQFTIDFKEKPKEVLVGDPTRFCSEISKPILEVSL